VEEEILGTGQWGTVVECWPWTCPKMTFALKSIPVAEIDTQTLHNEINILKKLDHPNVIKYYDDFEDKK